MRLKDLELPCYVMLNQYYGNPYRYATKVVEVEPWERYKRPTKKVVAYHCKISGYRTAMVVEDWTDKLTPGRSRAPSPRPRWLRG